MTQHSEAGKGSKRRPRLVSQEQADKNYEAFQRSMRKDRQKAAKGAREPPT